MSEEKPHNSSPVIVLAAGLSERMGMMKPLLKFSGDETFLEHIVEAYRKYGASEIMVVTNKVVSDKIKKIKNLKIIINAEPQLGRMGSVILGLSALKNKNSCFIQNCDNPFVNVSLLKDIEINLKEDNYVTPSYKGKGGHPILLGEKVIAYICEQKKPDAELRELLKQFKRKNVETDDEKILCNINTIEDYNFYFGKNK